MRVWFFFLFGMGQVAFPFAKLRAQEWGDEGPTRVVVHVYKIRGLTPLYHTGVVVDGREYYFNSSNSVKVIEPRKISGMKFHREMVRNSPKSKEDIAQILEETVEKWNDQNYHLVRKNCNFFTNDLLRALGLPEIDKEYLNAGGLRSFTACIVP